MNIISKLHILKDTAVFTSEKLSQKFWCGTFQALQKMHSGIRRREKVKLSLQFFGQVLAQNA